MSIISKVECQEYFYFFVLKILEFILKYYKIGKYYLDDKNYETEKPLDLFTIIVDDNKLHPHFEYLLKQNLEK